MNKWLFFLSLLLAIVFAACESESVRDQAVEDLAASGETKQQAGQTLSGKDLLDSLRQQAVREDDKAGRIAMSLKPLREEFAKSEKVMPDLKQVRLEVGEDCILHLYNEAHGKEEIRVDLLKLDLNGFSLIPDFTQEDWPGLRIRTVNGEAAVEVYRDGKLVESRESLEIYMAERKNIERITPVMVQLLRICRDLN